MRVVIANQFGSVVGGAETYAFSIAKALAENGHLVAIAFAESPGNAGNDFNISGVEWLGRLDSPVSWLNAISAFAPDAVYSQVLADPRIDEALGARWPVVMFNHNHSGACISGNKRFRFPSVAICNRSLGISCLAAHWVRRCGGLNPITALRAYRRERARLKGFKRARTICVASRHMRSVMIQNGVPEDKVRLLPLFPTHGEPDPAPPALRPRTDKVLLAGRLTRLKGWKHLVPAIAMASKQLGRRLVLMVAGDGPDRGRLGLLARKWDVPLEDHGWQASAGITRLMREADLLAVPSLWPEPFGLVGIEAGCVGTPAVAYAVGGIPDWLIPGISGELAPAESLRPRPLADAIARALQDAGHWQRLREGAWRQSGEFSRQRHIEELVGILRGAMV